MQNAPSPSNLSDARLRLVERMAARQGAAVPEISPTATDAASPLSFAQERYYLLEQVMDGLGVYHVPKAFRMEGSLDRAALRQALERLVERHQILRTTYGIEGGALVQRVAPHPRFELKEISLEHVPEAETEAKFRELAHSEIHSRFDLSRDLAIRATLFRLAEGNNIVLLVQHHISSDDTSGTVLARELGSLYSSCVAGSSSKLPELPVQYRDFAQWQRNWMSGSTAKESLSWWKQQLDGVPSVLELPADRQRLPVQSYRGGRLHRSVRPELARALLAIGKRESASLFMTLLAAFQVFLHRYTRQEDIAIGSPIANRDQVATEGLIGPFTNNIVLRANFGEDLPFSAFLRKTRRSVLDAFDHRDLPFEKLLSELSPDRNLSHAPVFQTMFVHQDGSARVPEWPGLRVSAVDLEPGTAKFDLQVSTIQTGSEIRVQYDYSSDLFDRETVERMSRHFENLLESIAANPEEICGRLRLIDPLEETRILTDWNRTEAEYPRDEVLPRLIEQQVARTPDAIALTFGRENLSYRNLNTKANLLAGYLRSLGCERGTLVGVALERSPDLVVALLAVLKCGGTYIPLDPGFPQERLTAMIADSGMKLLLTTSAILEVLPLEGVRPVCLDRDAAEIAESREQPVCASTPEDAAYVIYTSGSTGKPKGVAVPHRAVVNFLNSMRREPGLAPADVLLAVTTLSFDIAGLELFLPLTTGARIVLANRDQASDGVSLHELISSSGATVMQATPSTWRLMIDSGWQGNRDLKILCGGEAMSRALAQQLLPRCKELWNLYGPTETTIWSAASLVRAGDGPVPIGRPIDNTQFYILDRHMQPVPVGVPGELLIGGDGVALGYLNRPELTSEKFLANPFRAGGRVYRTGDLARFTAAGTVEFLGRLDFQVKIRGFRIELGEIETVLGRHPDISGCVVAAQEDSRGGARLIAYFVARGEAPKITELRRFLKESLPEYMIPAAFVHLDSLPLTLNGKIDRAKLKPPTGTRPDLEREYVAPQTPVEEAVAAVWREVFRIEEIGSRDNFFELGGNSLMGAHMLWKLRQIFSTDIPMRKIFEVPTIAELAAFLSQRMIENEDTEELARLLDQLEGVPGE